MKIQAVLITVVLCLLAQNLGYGQMPFQRTRQVFMIVGFSSQLAEFSIPAAGGVSSYDILGNPTFGPVSALGFRKTDNFLYGIVAGINQLSKIGQNGTSQNLGQVGLNTSLIYKAGDVTPDGKLFCTIGSDANGDVHLAKITLENGVFTTVFVNLPFGRSFSDLAFEPSSGICYAYDAVSRKVGTLNINNGAFSELQVIPQSEEIFGLYFDAFNDLYGIGSAVGGFVSAAFSIAKNTGKTTLIATGASFFMVADIASCPFSVEMKCSVDPLAALSCTDLTYFVKIANNGGETLSGLGFEHRLPKGFYFKQLPLSILGVPFDTVSIPGTLRLENVSLSPGIRDFSFKATMGEVPSGYYRNQCALRNLPPVYGSACFSDNPETGSFEDSTVLQVNYFAEDSLFFNWLICHGDSITLFADDYGANISWNTGSTARRLRVGKAGIYSLEAKSNCKTLFVRHDVASASCPYTIALKHFFVPDSIFTCSQTVARFYLINDSGEARTGITFSDKLPPGISFVEILSNPAGGNLKKPLPGNEIEIENMTLKVGIDSLDLLVEIGNAAPGKYSNRAAIDGFPVLMGPFRISDNPKTPDVDSTVLQVLGGADSANATVILDTICRNQTIFLDAGGLAKDFQWENGSKAQFFEVTNPGAYFLRVLDGCNPWDIEFQVAEGSPIEVLVQDSFFIHQGESVEIPATILNSGDSLGIFWLDPLGNSLSCLNCPKPIAMPLENTIYRLKAVNAVCTDSVDIQVFVDETRRIFAPNIFSPNGDGFNDYFFLQSPDIGKIVRFLVFDRWGNLVFRSNSSQLNVEHSGWDGRLSNGKISGGGTFAWLAEVEFLDGELSVFSGDVTVLK